MPRPAADAVHVALDVLLVYPPHGLAPRHLPLLRRVLPLREPRSTTGELFVEGTTDESARGRRRARERRGGDVARDREAGTRRPRRSCGESARLTARTARARRERARRPRSTPVIAPRPGASRGGNMRTCSTKRARAVATETHLRGEDLHERTALERGEHRDRRPAGLANAPRARPPSRAARTPRSRSPSRRSRREKARSVEIDPGRLRSSPRSRILFHRGPTV